MYCTEYTTLKRVCESDHIPISGEFPFLGEDPMAR